ncbi:MAG: sialate O-acetylesterase [Flavisolibacter sp.]
MFAFFAFNTVKADIRLPAIISSNMVLQQNSKMKLWGWGDPNEKVVVTTSWNTKKDSTKVDENAKWLLEIQTPKAGGPYTITIKGNNSIVLQNVLIGEVWIGSGQSNMEMNYYWGMPQMKEDFPTAANNNIRMFLIPRTTATTPQDIGEGKWVECDSNTVKHFSAVAYYFGKKLNANLNMPVGLIQAAWGGTPAEVWTPAEFIINDYVLNGAIRKLNRSSGWPITPGYTYNAMLAPITNYSIAGAIWYQGEGNTTNADTYDRLFATMINSWRTKFNKEFPFYFVQLAPYRYGNKNVAALIREAQTKTLAVPKTGMIITTDLADDTLDIHPKNKRDVGYRLADLALKNTYGLDMTYNISPSFESMQIGKSRIIVSFKDKSTGFMVRGKVVSGLFIAGENKIFYPATARMEGDKIIVSSKKVSMPVAVRYAFSNTAVGNIYNKSGMPLAPFRTDNWPVDTSNE